MSDAGAWQKQLPESWEVFPLKAVAACVVSSVDKLSEEGEKPVRLCNYREVYNHEFIRPDMDFMKATATLAEAERFRLMAGDVVITKDSESWDDIGVPALVVEPIPDLVCGYHLAILRADREKLQGRFLFRCLQSKLLRLPLELASVGVTRFGLPKDAITRLSVPIPPLAQQDAIAARLDRETAEIDEMVAEKEKMLRILEEKRGALITRAVTRGIDPKAKMKPSGAEWLPDIPSSWEMRRGKVLFDEIDERTTTGEETLLSLRMTRGLVPHNDVSEKPISSEELVGYKLTSLGDIVVNRMRASSGLVAVTPQPGLVSPDYAVFRKRADLEPEFYVHLFRTPLLQAIFRSESKGLGTGSMGFLRLYSENFLALKYPTPDPTEQRKIVAALWKIGRETDEMETALRDSIRLLTDRRAALITAAVTGSIAVPAASVGDSGKPSSISAQSSGGI